MEKLTEAGRLYLADYNILEEARKDMNRYLNAVVDEAYELLNEEIDEMAPEHFEMFTWQNNSSKGIMHASFRCISDIKIFRKGKLDLKVNYRDIRKAKDLTDPKYSKIYLRTPKISSDLEDKLRSLSQAEIGEDIYRADLVRLDYDSSSKTADDIKENILEKCNIIRKLIIKLIEKEELV